MCDWGGGPNQLYNYVSPPIFLDRDYSKPCKGKVYKNNTRWYWKCERHDFDLPGRVPSWSATVDEALTHTINHAKHKR